MGLVINGNSNFFFFFTVDLQGFDEHIMSKTVFFFLTKMTGPDLLYLFTKYFRKYLGQDKTFIMSLISIGLKCIKIKVSKKTCIP